MNPIISWIRQPTTLQGFALLIFAVSGFFTKMLTANEAGLTALSALPLVGIKDNSSTILHQAQVNGVALRAPVPGAAVVELPGVVLGK